MGGGGGCRWAFSTPLNSLLRFPLTFSLHYTHTTTTTTTTGKEWYLTRLKDVALNGEKAWTQNNMFEFNVVSGYPPPLSSLILLS